MNRIPALDGIRGIAILLVIADHLQLGVEGRYYIEGMGMFGVTLFFTLSGYLITGNLMSDGNLGAFYVKRFFRLMPAAWMYLGCMALLKVGSILPALLFYRNFVDIHEHDLMTAHFWSLSIEEQFYMLWPLILLLFRRKAIWIALPCAALVAGHRYIDAPTLLRFRTDYRADAILIGCAIALWNPRIRWPRFLAWRPLAYVGTISYSLYLWQEFTLRFPGFQAAQSIPFRLGAMFALGCTSYYLVERPLARIGKRFARQLSSERTAAGYIARSVNG